MDNAKLKKKKNSLLGSRVEKNGKEENKKRAMWINTSDDFEVTKYRVFFLVVDVVIAGQYYEKDCWFHVDCGM